MSQTSDREDAIKLVATAGLLLTDAMVLQEATAAFDSRIPTLSSFQTSGNLKKDFEDAWQLIIKKINYEPILEIALRILRSLPASPAMNARLRSLVDLAYDIASSKVLLRHDLFGRVYHTLLLGKLVKYYATYFTSIPAARLLGRLLVHLPSTLNLKKIPPTYNREPLRVIDFACGSGTLISAIYKELDIRHRTNGKVLRLEDLHKYLIEQGIWGFDVLHHAVHLASTVLFLHSPVPVKTSKLFALRLGDREFLGSVNFLKSAILSSKMLLVGETADVQNIGLTRRETTTIELPLFHICIMNPPFTRSVGGNLLFGSLPKEERTVLQKELRKILKEIRIEGIGQAGLGAVFAFLADRYLTKEGRIGLVLPRAVLSGVSWQKVRDMLLKKYHVEYIITSYEPPNSWNFSENTDLSEVLLVAKKTQDAKGHTFFVNLWKKPRNEIESVHIGSQLVELYDSAKLYDIENSNASPYHLKLHGEKVAEVYSAKLAENFGIYNLFSQMELNRMVVLLRKGIVYLPDKGVLPGRINLTSLSRLGAVVGPDVKQVHSTFRASKTGRGAMYKAFWGYDSSITKQISQKPNSFLEPKNNEQARRLWERSGNLLIVERARLSTYTALAVHLAENALSNVWWPVKVKDDRAKILSVWLNSTLGILLLLSIAEVTQGPWVKFKKEHLWQMPLLDTDKLTPESREKLLALYDNVSTLELKSLPEEFANPFARKKIDDGVAEALKLNLKLDSVYKLLSQDPMITASSLNEEALTR